MKASEFVERLKALDPPVDVQKREEDVPIGDALVDLVLNYDVADMQFGDIIFADDAFEDEDTYEVGNFEEKFLIVDRKSGEVRIEDDDEEGTILYSCAQNGEKFLDALLAAAKFISDLVEDRLSDDDLDHCEAKAMECAKLAGSDEYFPFFQDFLNCYEGDS